MTKGNRWPTTRSARIQPPEPQPQEGAPTPKAAHRPNPRSARFRTAATAALATAALLAAATACLNPADDTTDATGDGDGDVVTLETGPAAATPTETEPTPATAAEAMVACLTDARLPVTLGGTVESPYLSWDESYNWFVLWPTGETSGEGSPPVDDPFWLAHQADDAGATPPGLVIDGADHSETFTACLDSSGYTKPPPAPDNVDQSHARAEYQKQADVNNTWTACARDNGLPGLPDYTLPADLWEVPSPSAEIPLSTSAAALRTAVAACPIFDEERARAEAEADFNSEDWPPKISVKVEPLPDPPAPDAPEAELAAYEALTDHAAELEEIIYGPYQDFLNGTE